MKRTLIIFCMCALVIVGGTSCVSHMTKLEFAQQIVDHSVEDFNFVWYIGSTETRDMFNHRTTFRNHKISIPKGDFVLPRRFPVTKDRTKWVLMKGKNAFLKGNTVYINLTTRKISLEQPQIENPATNQSLLIILANKTIKDMKANINQPQMDIRLRRTFTITESATNLTNRGLLWVPIDWLETQEGDRRISTNKILTIEEVLKEPLGSRLIENHVIAP